MANEAPEVSMGVGGFRGGLGVAVARRWQRAGMAVVRVSNFGRLCGLWRRKLPKFRWGSGGGGDDREAEGFGDRDLMGVQGREADRTRQAVRGGQMQRVDRA